MYGQHFGLASPPFRITPDTRRFYPGAQRGAVLDALAYAVEQGEGIVKLCGEVGSGKTMLCRMLADRLARTVDVVYLANPSLKREDVLQAIALDLKLPTEGGRLAVLNSLQDYLLKRHAEGRRVAVFVEEAQGMDLEALEEIRFLSNLETREEKLLQIVLFGQPELDDHLAVHEVRQLRDRITHSFTLPPLTLADIRDYITFRLRAAGYQGGDPFSPTACRLLKRASSGLIRRIHILADKALLAAYADGRRQVHLKHMRRAVADSEFAGGGLLLPPSLRAVAAGLALIAVSAVGTYWMTNALLHTPTPAIAQAQEPALVVVTRPMEPSTLPIAAIEVADDPAEATHGEPLSIFAARVAATRRMLTEAPAGSFTIQVMTSGDDRRAPLEQMLLDPRLAGHLEQLYIAPTLVNGTQRWSVLFGGFEHYADAQRALNDIPPSLKGRGPYLRSINAVKKEAAGHWMLAAQDA